jgi:hypothetical protein
VTLWHDFSKVDPSAGSDNHARALAEDSYLITRAYSNIDDRDGGNGVDTSKKEIFH